MTGFSAVLLKDGGISELKKLNSSGALPLGVLGASYIHKLHLASVLSEENGALIIMPNELEALRAQKDLCQFGIDALYCPSKEFVFREMEGMSRQYEHRRLDVLEKMLEGKATVVCSASTALQFTIPPQALREHTLTVKKGQETDIETLRRVLVSSGYVHSAQVDGVGQFSVRGGIVDIFPPCCQNPVRLEFWGDEVESIFSFDVESQRRTSSMTEFKIIPVREVIFDDVEAFAEKIEKLASSTRKKELKETLLAQADFVRSGRAVGADRFLPIAYDSTATIFDYLGNMRLIVCESASVKESVNAYITMMNEDISALLEEGVLCKGMSDFYIGFSALCQMYEKHRAVYIDLLPRGSFDTKTQYLLSIQARQLSGWNGSMELLLEDIKPALEQDYSCVVTCPTNKGARVVAEDLINEGVNAVYFDTIPPIFPPRTVSVIKGNFSCSMEYPELKFLMISHSSYTVPLEKKKKKQKAFNSICSLEEISKGDYVVHATHGIGIFDGIHNIEFQGIRKDYIKIRYAKDEAVYVPVTQLDLVSRYIGNRDESKIKLSKLGGVEWKNAKSRARKAVRDMADELIALYSKRAQSKGHAFLPDGELQRDFECHFEFDETDDQLRCAREIKEDMEKSVPMDRLLCGDVGFGKTEVALRAAFKCICEGKQCVILVPTTILAFQHYGTIMKRFSGFPIEAEMLSRFRTPKQQREIKQRLKNGSIDIIVGTHKLLSKDIEYHDVGLLIVDEEQRFGVAQKEKLKELFPDVDVLTLSATPIPRTLNMAMSGIRDMSVLEEAPTNRYPVQTYVMEHNNAVLMQAMRKELARGGQCYYLHNNIESISSVAFRISQEIEGARVAVAHGKMGEEELSEVWRKLLENEIDILVCTTIIETGVDVPNANTLIIDGADRMGLSQLHQIRGRVGRSGRRAYAYLTFTRGKELSEIANSRLSAIREFTEFGAGFKIAMRDLEIRGAGNVLGAQQHGHMEAIGYDMYIKMLGEAVKEKKGEKSSLEKPECLIDLPIEAHIPEKYIDNVAHRLSIYRKIADIRNQADADDVVEELVDRFGKPPKAVMGLIEVALLRNKAAALDIYEIRKLGGSLLLFISDIDPEKVKAMSRAMKKRISVGVRGGKEHIAVKMLDGQTSAQALKEVLEVYGA
ncbi:MAG: transcription-repair coupling factor [Clostridia bacterium]|nr:transcription-repair coupling factor [Clostridia bacterium]